MAIEEVKSGAKKADVARKFSVSRQTLATWLKAADSIREAFYSGGNLRKRARLCANPDIEETLLLWIKKGRSANIPLSGPIIKEKAEELASSLGKSDFRCSDGWLTRFKKRHSITFRALVGEAASVDGGVVASWQKDTLPMILSRYKPEDVYNMDETGLFYKCPNKRSMVMKGETCANGKLSKERITLVMCANMTGSDKLPVLVLGKSANPRCFKGVKTLPCPYRSNKRAWMTMDEFSKWLKDFDRRTRLRGRKVALVLDNAPSHVHISTTHVELYFLPPNTTALSQPMDQGIIKCMKDRYRKQISRRMLDALDANRPFSITLLDSLLMIRRAWDAVSPETIAHCFRHCHFDTSSLPLTEPDRALDDEDELPLSELLQLLHKRGADVDTNAEDVLQMDDALATEAELSDQDIIDQVKMSVEEDIDDDDAVTDDVEDDPPKTASYTEAVLGLDACISYMQTLEDSDDMFRHVTALQTFLVKSQFDKKKQGTLDSFFKL